MQEYRVLRGTFLRSDRTVATPGDTVELSEEQREQFSREKFEPVEDEEEPSDDGTEGDAAEQEEEPSPDDAEETAEEASDDATDDEEAEDSYWEKHRPEASTDIPKNDWQLLQKMAMVADDDTIDGRTSSEEIEEVLGQYEPEEIAQLKRKAQAKLED